MIHLLIEVTKTSDPEILNDIEGHKALMEELIEKLGITLIDEIVIKKTSAGFNDWGLSGNAMITTSHLAFHSFLPQNHVFFDIFSCKKFDAELAEKILINFYKGATIKVQSVERGKNFDLYMNYPEK
ncbi:S-adenosylmethionine decarboxylase [bacterium]|nr:S-adenosylmethionine decarboxylase [bacterium]